MRRLVLRQASLGGFSEVIVQVSDDVALIVSSYQFGMFDLSLKGSSEDIRYKQVEEFVLEAPEGGDSLRSRLAAAEQETEKRREEYVRTRDQSREYARKRNGTILVKPCEFCGISMKRPEPGDIGFQSGFAQSFARKRFCSTSCQQTAGSLRRAGIGALKGRGE